MRQKSSAPISVNVLAVRITRRVLRGKHWCILQMLQLWESNSRMLREANSSHRLKTCQHGISQCTLEKECHFRLSPGTSQRPLLTVCWNRQHAQKRWDTALALLNRWFCRSLADVWQKSFMLQVGQKRGNDSKLPAQWRWNWFVHSASSASWYAAPAWSRDYTNSQVSSGCCGEMLQVSVMEHQVKIESTWSQCFLFITWRDSASNVLSYCWPTVIPFQFIWCHVYCLPWSFARCLSSAWCDESRHSFNCVRFSVFTVVCDEDRPRKKT